MTCSYQHLYRPQLFGKCNKKIAFLLDHIQHGEDITSYLHSQIWSRTHEHTHTHSPAKESPREGCCAHNVYCSPQLLISCFPCVMRGHPTQPAHKNCSRTPSLKPVCSLLTPKLPPKQDSCFSWHSRDRLVAHSSCFPSVPLICSFTLKSSLLLHQHPPPPSSLSSSQISQVQGAFIKRTADHAQQKVPPAIS